MFKVTSDTWLISDTHFGHDNIIKYCDRPLDHDMLMIESWIYLVKPEDVILHLGDVWFGKGTDAQYWSDVISILPGKKYLILGNHDRANTHFYRDAGFEIIKPFIQDGIAFSHYPMNDRNGEVVSGKLVKTIKSKYFPPEDEEWFINIHGHVHNNKPVVYGRHMPMRPPQTKIFFNLSVEVWDYKPVRFGDLIDLACAKLEASSWCEDLRKRLRENI